MLPYEDLHDHIAKEASELKNKDKNKDIDILPRKYYYLRNRLFRYNSLSIVHHMCMFEKKTLKISSIQNDWKAFKLIRNIILYGTVLCEFLFRKIRID